MDYFEELEHLDFYQADTLINVVDNLAFKLAKSTIHKLKQIKADKSKTMNDKLEEIKDKGSKKIEEFKDKGSKKIEEFKDKGSKKIEEFKDKGSRKMEEIEMKR